jgi:DNA repair protein RadA/Sms
MFGEVGLAGEIRGITQAPLRVREAAQMGFRQCIMPDANIDPDRHGSSGRENGRPSGSSSAEACELIGVRTVGEALDALMP